MSLSAPSAGSATYRRYVPFAFSAGIVAVTLFMGLSVRWMLRDFVSDDWNVFLKFWQRFLITFGGFPALRYAFSNYSAPYTYLLALSTQTLGGLPALYQIKFVTIVFDVVLAILASRLVAFYRPGPMWPALAFALVFLAPTVLLNSAAWAQADAIFTTFLLAALLALLHKHNSLAMTLYAIAISFKLQAGFALPLFVSLAWQRQLPWRTFLLLPVVYALVNVPALLVGRPLADAFLVYGAQVDRYDDLTLKAPNLFQWLPPDPRALLQWVGFGMAGVFVLSIWFIVRKWQILPLALALCIGLPFFLPRMHDRYFYPADVLSIVCAVAFVRAGSRRSWVWGAITVLVQVASLAAYVTYLWERDASVPKIPLAFAAALMAIALVLVIALLFGQSRESGNPVFQSMGAESLPTGVQAVDSWMPAYAGVTVVTLVIVVGTTLIGANARMSNDRALRAATFDHGGYSVELHRALAEQCADAVHIDMAWVNSTLRRAPRTETYSVFVHVYNAGNQRIAVADGYVDGAFPLNDVEFDLSEVRSVTLDPSQQAAQVRVGVYAVETLQRFRALKQDGTSWDGDEVVIPVISCRP
jgi:Gpi18-like mannosyltransferase